MTTPKPKDFWDKLLALSGLIASILVPIVVVIVTNTYTNAMKESENRIRYIELAIGILRSDPKPETQGLRAWAVEVVDKHSIVPFDPKVKQEILDQQVKVVYPVYDGGTTYENVYSGSPVIAVPKGQRDLRK